MYYQIELAVYDAAVAGTPLRSETLEFRAEAGLDVSHADKMARTYLNEIAPVQFRVSHPNERCTVQSCYRIPQEGGEPVLVYPTKDER